MASLKDLDVISARSDARIEAAINRQIVWTVATAVGIRCHRHCRCEALTSLGSPLRWDSLSATPSFSLALQARGSAHGRRSLRF